MKPALMMKSIRPPTPSSLSQTLQSHHHPAVSSLVTKLLDPENQKDVEPLGKYLDLTESEVVPLIFDAPCLLTTSALLFFDCSYLKSIACYLL